MDSKETESIADNNYKKDVSRIKHLSFWETVFSGMIMGFIAYSGSFSIVPIVFTLTALTFGTKSLITIYMTAIGQLVAGYVHTHSSRTGMALSTRIFRGFYIAEPEMRNRRLYNETRCESLKRFFGTCVINAFVLNFMWQTFTIYYLIQSNWFISYTENWTTNGFEHRYLLIQGFTRYLAGCLSGMSTAVINHVWQRYLARRTIPLAKLNTDKKKLKLEWKERKKLLSPCNMENWIKAFVMLIGALFIIASNVPNKTALYLLSPRRKRIITDVLVINGGWLFIRDAAMLLLKKSQKPQKALDIPLNTIQSPPTADDNQMIDDEQSKMLTTTVQIH